MNSIERPNRAAGDSHTPVRRTHNCRPMIGLTLLSGERVPMTNATLSAIVVVLVTLLAFGAKPAGAHCDALDGPVVLAAKEALEKGDVTPVLKWVKADDEEQVRAAFAKTLKVRGLSDDARELADRYFFETLVRIHRAGEGVAFSGLKPAGEVDPGIAAADKAIAEGSADDLAAELGEAVVAGLRARFRKVISAKARADEIVEAGRAYVAAYVEYIHYVEAVHARASAPPTEHHHIHAPAR